MAINVGFKYLTDKYKFNLSDYQEKVSAVHKMIEEKTGAGSDYLGWLHYPSTMDTSLFFYEMLIYDPIERNLLMMKNFDYYI